MIGSGLHFCFKNPVSTVAGGSINWFICKVRAIQGCAARPLSIRGRIAVLVLALLLPMNALMVAAVVELNTLTREAQYSNLRYTASVIAGAVEAQLTRYLAIAGALATSPAILDDDLSAFRREVDSAFLDISEAWPIVSDSEGHVIMALRPAPARRRPEGIAAQNRAFELGSPIIGGVYRTHAGEWIATVEHPVFRDGKPFRTLVVAMSAESFLGLLDAQRLPDGWTAGIADMNGSFVARSIGDAARAGQKVSKGWRATLGHPGIYKSVSLEGSKLVGMNEVSPLSGWTIGVAVTEDALEAPVRATLRWAISAGIAVCLLSLMLAIFVARRITRPIHELERAANALVSGRPATLAHRLPEIERVWHALRSAAAERQRLEHDLRRNAHILRTASEGAGFCAHEFDTITRRTWWGPDIGRLLGLDRSTHAVVTLEEAQSFIHPEDAGRISAAWRDIVKGPQRKYELEFRIVRQDGEVRWLLDRGQTVKDPVSGRTARVIGVAIDITERKLGELRQQMLLKELSHRVKNTLAIVQSIATQTLRATKDPAEFAGLFTSRLISLSRAHTLLTQRAWQGAPLGDIVNEAIAPFLSTAGESAFVIDGQPVEIAANSTITLALMLHELLSNAAKYGALSTLGGRVTISWEATETPDGRQIDLYWKEEGGPPAAVPERKGFGTRLLAMSAEQLGGKISLDYAPSGLRCHLRFPMPALEPASDFRPAGAAPPI